MCKQMITPNAEAGAVDRYPPPRECTSRIWKDGYCTRHHPEKIKKKLDEEAEWAAGKEERILNRNKLISEAREHEQAKELLELSELTEEKCVMFLLSKGYTIAKQQ